MVIRLATRCPFLIIGAAIMAMRIDLKLSIIFLIAIPIIGVLLYSVTCWTIPRYGENQGKLDNIARHTRENLDGVRVIRAFSRQDEEIESYRNDCDVFAKRSIAVGRVGAILNPASFFIMNMGIVAVLLMKISMALQVAVAIIANVLITFSAQALIVAVVAGRFLYSTLI